VEEQEKLTLGCEVLLGSRSLPEIEVMLTIKNTNLTLPMPDESIAAIRRGGFLDPCGVPFISSSLSAGVIA